MILAILLAATTATAAPEASPATAGAPPAAAAPNGDAKPAEKMICRTETPLGTRFGKKVCRPAASYQALGAEERKAVEAAQKGFSGCGVGFNNTRC